MSVREKPFPYDAIETPEAVLFVIDDQGADGRPAHEITLTLKGLQILRADGVVLRMIHLHPRLACAIPRKPTYMVEVTEDDARIYGASDQSAPIGNLMTALTTSFYWYLGPETASLQDLLQRPFTRLLGSVLPQAVAVAPGEDVTGPLIGLCLARPGMVALTRGRNWTHVAGGLVVDAGLISGRTTGHPANDNIEDCVRTAHSDTAAALKPRDRIAWSSQLAVAFRPVS